jgi:hypothetical protein
VRLSYSHGSSTQQRPLIQTRTQSYSITDKTYSVLADGRFARRWRNPPSMREAAPTACAVVICIASVSRFHTRSRVRAPAKSLLRFRRGDVVPNRRRNLYLHHYSAVFASFRAPIPASPLSASRLSTPRLWGTIRAYSVPLIGHVKVV